MNRPTNGVNILEFYRSDGVIDWSNNVKKNWFGIVAKDGTIRTFFKPNADKTYWDNQIAREQP